MPETGVNFIMQDNYYRDLSGLSPEERDSINFDHPDSVEISLMKEHIQALQRGHAFDSPVYNFDTHLRSPETRRVEPKDLIIVDGIFSLHQKEIRDLCDLKIFVDLESGIRLLRRIRRDIKQRGRSLESILT